MKSNIFTIMRKEFARFFKDRRMVLTTLVMPGLMIYVLYSFMGSAITNMVSPNEEYEPVIYAMNLPDSVAGISGNAGIKFTKVSFADEQQIKQDITDKNCDLLVVFPTDFDAVVAGYDVQASSGPAPNIEIYFNSSSTNSQSAFYTVTGILDAYESALANKFDVNSGNQTYDLVTERDSSSMFISSMLPLLLIMFLFSGCMAIAPESIAGEKERGTIATLLVTPLRRSELAMGKVFSLAAIAFLSGLSSFTGTMLSLPKLFSMGGGDSVNLNIYGFAEYGLLALVIISTILLIITLISIISAFAKSVKEATTAVMPLMVVVMVIGVTGMFGTVKSDYYYYLIPLYNSVQCMAGIFSFNFSVTNVVITAVSNSLYAFAGGFVLTRMFNSEKVMFNR